MQLDKLFLFDKKNNILSSLKLGPVIFEMVKGKYLYIAQDSKYHFYSGKSATSFSRKRMFAW